jgi:hypothetical protein
MTAFLSANVLRADAAPNFPCVLFWGAHEPSWPRRTPRPRPALTARWLIAPDGRLSCRWQTVVSASFGPPPA